MPIASAGAVLAPDSFQEKKRLDPSEQFPIKSIHLQKFFQGLKISVVLAILHDSPGEFGSDQGHVLNQFLCSRLVDIDRLPFKGRRLPRGLRLRLSRGLRRSTPLALRWQICCGQKSKDQYHASYTTQSSSHKTNLFILRWAQKLIILPAVRPAPKPVAIENRQPADNRRIPRHGASDAQSASSQGSTAQGSRRPLLQPTI